MAKIEIMPLDIDPAIYLAKLKGYTDIPTALFRDKNLTMWSIIIYAYMYGVAFPIDVPFLYVSVTMLTKHLKISPSTVSSALTQLENQGYIFKEFIARGQDNRIHNLHEKLDELDSNRQVVYRISFLVNYDTLDKNSHLNSFRLRVKEVCAYGLKNAVIYGYIHQYIVNRKLKLLKKNIQVSYIIQDLSRCSLFIYSGLRALEKQGLIVWPKSSRGAKSALQLAKTPKKYKKPKGPKRTLMDTKELWWERQRKYKERAEARKLAKTKS